MGRLQQPPYHCPTWEMNHNKGPPSKRSRPNMHEDITAFHHQYWGHPLNRALTTLPTYVPDLESEEDTNNDVLPGKPFLNVLDTTFLVRAEYIRALNMVKAIFNESPRTHLAVVTGQPGIGKTLWIYYALCCCLGRGAACHLVPKWRILFLLKQWCGKFPSIDKLNPNYTWCFVDSTNADLLPDKIHDSLNKLFPIYVTSPKEERWRRLHQLRMPKLSNTLSQKLIDIFERFEKVGPSARLCLSSSQAEILDFYASRNAQINFNTARDMLVALLDEKSQRLRIGDISHQFCMVRRSDSQSIPYIVEPISAVVRCQLLTQLWQWKDKDHVEMMERFSRIQGAAGMIGLLFESCYQHRFATQIEIELTQMFRGPDPRSRWHAVFGDFSESPKLHGAWQKASNEQSHKSLSISPSDFRTYEHGKSKIVIEEDVYYVPFTGNEAAIDPFIVHDNNLYMFQFASGPQHSVNPGLLTTLDRFSRLPPVANRHLIFIVPKTLHTFNCPHSDNGFLHDHVSYIARVDLISN